MPEKGASRHISGEMNLNTVTEEELAKVSDIGAQRAHKIVEYRDRHGKFNSVDDLQNVEGFGDTLVNDLRLSLTVSDSEHERPEHGGSESRRSEHEGSQHSSRHD